MKKTNRKTKGGIVPKRRMEANNKCYVLGDSNPKTTQTVPYLALLVSPHLDRDTKRRQYRRGFDHWREHGERSLSYKKPSKRRMKSSEEDKAKLTALAPMLEIKLLASSRARSIERRRRSIAPGIRATHREHHERPRESTILQKHQRRQSSKGAMQIVLMSEEEDPAKAKHNMQEHTSTHKN